MYSVVMVQEVLQRRWEPWRWGVQWLAIGSWQRPIESHHQSWSPYNYTRSCWRTRHWPFYGFWAFEADWKGEKSSIRGCLVRWPRIKRNVVLKCHLLFYTTTSHFSDCDMWWKVNFRQQPAMTSSMVRPWRSPKALPKAKLAPKKRSGSLFCGLLPIWSTTAFWIPVKPFHLRRMFSKYMRCVENCSACSRHWSTERGQFFSMIMPDHTSHNQCFKSWMNWATKSCAIHHIHLTSDQLITTSSSILTTLCREDASTTSRMLQMLS